MTISIFHRLVRFITYLSLTSSFLFLVGEVDLVSARSEIRTKLLLQNIRTHLAQKVDEAVQQKECESGLIFCKSTKNKEGEDEKSEEIPPPPKIMRGHHKPIIKVNTKTIIQTIIPKPKSLFKKALKEGNGEKRKFSPFKPLEPSSTKEIEESEEEEKPSEQFKKTDKPIREQLNRLPDVKKVKSTEPKSIKEAKPEVKVKPKAQEGKVEKDTKPEAKVKPKVQESKIEKKTKVKDEKKVKYGDSASKKEVLEQPKLKGLEEVEERKKVDDVKKKKEEQDSLFSEEIFLFVLDSDEVKTDLCRKQSQIYLKQLKKYKIWALMMYDASAKIPSGILHGNVNQLGDFDECLSINAVFKSSKVKRKDLSGIKGKYCLANIDVTTNSESNLQEAVKRLDSFSFIKSTIHDPGHFIPKFSSIYWGLCIPSACPAEDVENHMKFRMKDFNGTSGVFFDLLVEESNCVKKEDLKFNFDSNVILAFLFYFIIILFAVCATYIDSKSEKLKTPSSEENILGTIDYSNEKYLKEDSDKIVQNTSLKEKLKSIIMAFSLKKNLKKLFSDNDTKNSINCIYGIKSVFTVMLYFAHKTIPLGMTPFSNRIFLTKISNEASTTLMRTSIIYTDSFLLLSGVLISYNLSKEINETGKISWIKKSLARVIRLTPASFAVVLFYAYIWNYLGSGPLWNFVVKKNSELCQKYMWRNLLYIQNLFAFEKMCAPQTHQLALDMQLSLLAPLFVHLLYKYDKVGIGILQALYLLSSIMRYISTSTNNLSIVIYHEMPVSQLYRTANLLYIQALHRSSPYILGTILGYYLKKYERKFDVPKAFIALGWTIAFAFGFYSVVSPSHLAYRDYKYDVQEAAQYAALSPVAWSLALSWLIIACHLGYGGKVNEFLCQKSLLVFSRISYSVYLTQFLVFFYNVGIKRIPEIFTVTGSVNITEFLIVIVISVIVTLLFDIPMIDIKKIIFNEQSKKRISLPEEKKLSEELELDSQAEEDSISQEESQEITDEIDYTEENIDENEEDEDEEEEGAGEDKDEEKIDYEEEIEDLEMQPLRRSTRIQFDDENEDSEWFKVEDDTKIDEEHI